MSHSLSPTETNRNCSRFGAVYNSKFFCKKKVYGKKTIVLPLIMNQISGGKKRGRRVRANLNGEKKTYLQHNRAQPIVVSIFALFLSRFNTSSYRCNVINGSDFFFKKSGGDKLPHSVRVKLYTCYYFAPKSAMRCADAISFFATIAATALCMPPIHVFTFYFYYCLRVDALSLFPSD